MYDENICDNNFYKKVLSDDELLAAVHKSNCLICVPRAGTIGEISQHDLKDHILVPSNHLINNQTYRKSASFNNEQNDITIKEDYQKGQEQFYITLNNEPIRINDEHIIQSDEKTIRILFEEKHYIKDKKLKILCIEKPLFSNVKSAPPTHLQSLEDCSAYLQSLSLEEGLRQIRDMCSVHRFRLDCLQTQRELLGKLYSQCLRIYTTKIDDRFKLAVETYMQNHLQDLMMVVNTFACNEDANFNRIRRSLGWITLEYFGTNFPKTTIDCATKELNKINDFQTVLQKIQCLANTINILQAQTCDQLIALLSFLIIHSDVCNWISNLIFLTQFQFSSSEGSGYDSYLKTTLEATIKHLKTIKDKPIVKTNERSKDLFTSVVDGNLPILQNLLETESHDPSCSCDSCIFGPRITHLNDFGQTLLHVTAMEDRPDFIEYLSRHQPINVKDKEGKTPLHYAAQFGNQDALIVLVSSGAKVNVKDDKGNSPLHLASFFGSDSCVKALLYTSKNIEVDARNLEGRTALSFAVKNSYVEIATVLLENGAGTRSIKSDCQNYIMIRLLESFESRCVTPSNIEYGIQGRTEQEMKTCDLLLKAIRDGDLRLACYYLGFASETSYDFKSKCHPLCDCEQCYDSDDNKPSTPTPINVNICNDSGFTSLHVAAQYGRSEICRILLDGKAKTNLRTYGQLQAPLHLACIYQKVGIVKQLLDCDDCQVDVIDCKGFTPLYYAETVKDKKIIELFEGIK